MATGVLARAALIASIYERGVHLTGKERVKLTNAALVNHISTDVSHSYDLKPFRYMYIVPQVSRIDACAQWFVSLHVLRS